jgi:outer membrane protein assembly factor BamB
MMLRLALAGLALSFACSLKAADWPQWRGAARDGISKETGLLQEWPKDGPKERWKRTEIGSGYSTPVVVGGKLYVQTTLDKEEFALCLDEKTGKTIWKVLIGGVGENRGMPYPGTRSTPTVDGERLYCLSSAGQLNCLAIDGTVKWKKDYTKDFGGVSGGERGWAYSESVLVDGDRLICTPGGKDAALVALNKLTGETVWKCALAAADGAEYSSVMPVAVGSGKRYVTFLRKGLVGVDAGTGKFLWQYSKVNAAAANIMTSVVHGDRVFTASSTGGALLQLKAEGDPSEVYFSKELGANIGAAVLIDGNLYGATTNGLFCAEFATGKVLWQERSIGGASICYADGRLYVRQFSNGDVVLVEPSATEYIEKGRVKQDNRSKFAAWPHPIVANGGLYVRDHDTLVCWDVKK